MTDTLLLLAFLDIRYSWRAPKAKTPHTAASIFFDESFDALRIVTASKFVGLRRAFNTC